MNRSMVQPLPFVSIVVAARNEQAHIGVCLESLLAQDHPNDRYEIIVVDNDSTDRTAEVIRRYPGVRYVFEHAGHSAAIARNRGISESRGELIAFTDADCVASSSWLRQGVAGFSEDRIGCVAGEIKADCPRTLAQRYAERRQALSQRWTLQEAFRPYAQTANAFYRRRVLEALGSFDASLVICEDADLAWRMQERLGLSIAFRPEAIVSHQHRETVKELLKQRAGYGYSSVLLYLKYRDQMGRWTLKHTYWDTVSFGRRVWSLVRACGASMTARLNGHGEPQAVAMASLDVLSYVAWKIGQLKGSLRHHVWYI